MSYVTISWRNPKYVVFRFAMWLDRLAIRLIRWSLR
jgi:hypothetical protein